MNYWQFKFKEENWNWWDVQIGDIEDWKSNKTILGKSNDIKINDIVFLYRTDKDRAIYFVSKVINVDFNKEQPIDLEIIVNLNNDPFIPEYNGYKFFVQKVNKLNQNGTYYKFDTSDNGKILYKLIVNYNKILDNDIETICDKANIDTKTQSIIMTRIGQGLFRNKLIEYWDGCSVTDCKLTEVLIASHIKPWKDSSDKERLDVYNGLLLLATVDKLFDKGYISFDNKGNIVISTLIEDYDVLGIDENMSIKIEEKHKKYLQFHRDNIFIK